MQDYRKLDVWAKAHELALDVHRLDGQRCDPSRVTADARRADAELLATLRRGAVRIPVLLVHGCEAETPEEFSRGMRDAAAAVDELAYLLRLAKDATVLEAVPYARLEARASQLRAMLGGLNRTVRLRIGASGPAAVPSNSSAGATAASVARALRGVRDDGASRRESRPRSTS